MGDKILKNLFVNPTTLPWEWCTKLRRKFPFFDKRIFKWRKQRSENNFDERDTWDLKFTTLCLLYPRLKWYREHANIDFDFHKIKIKKDTNTLGEWIDLILIIWENRLKNEDDEINNKKISYSFLVFGEIFEYLWW